MTARKFCNCGRPLLTREGDLTPTCGECRLKPDHCACAPVARRSGRQAADARRQGAAISAGQGQGQRQLANGRVRATRLIVAGNEFDGQHGHPAVPHGSSSDELEDQGSGTAELTDPLPQIPSFPVAEISGPLRSFIDWGIRDGLHPESVAAGGLAALVTLTGPARLRQNQTKVIKPILWIALIGINGSGRSAGIEHAFTQIRAAYAAKRADYEALLASWRESVDALGRKAAGPAPSRPQPFEADDITTEAVARWLLARGTDTSGAVIDDELAAFLEGLNQYKRGQGSDLSKWLKMWTGAPLHPIRVGKGGEQNEISLYVPEPVVSVAGPLVPDNLHLLSKPGSGFRPRWLPFYAPPRAPEVLDAGDYPEEWKNCIAALMRSRDLREWGLSEKSRGLWVAARKRWHDQHAGSEPDEVIEALRKADTQCLRIALVLAESIKPAKPGYIPAEAMQSAIAIVDYCIDVWRCLPGSSTMTVSRREDVMDAAHRRLTAWLDTRPAGTEGLPEGSRPRPRATRRELQRWLHEPPAKISELILEHSMRWPGCVVETKPQRGPVTLWIYAPERVYTPEPKLSRRQFPDEVYTPTSETVSARQLDATGSQETVAETVAETVRQFPATVSPRAAKAPTGSLPVGIPDADRPLREDGRLAPAGDADPRTLPGEGGDQP